MHRVLKVPDSWSYPASERGVAMTDSKTPDHIPVCADYDTLGAQISGMGMASLADDGNAKLVALGFNERIPFEQPLKGMGWLLVASSRSSTPSRGSIASGGQSVQRAPAGSFTCSTCDQNMP